MEKYIGTVTTVGTSEAIRFAYRDSATKAWTPEQTLSLAV